MDDNVENKKHRPRQSGRKAAKKKAKEPSKSHNAKAFSVQHTTKASRLVQRTLDHQTKRHRIVCSDYQAQSPPPYLVVIIGPPGSGKSTLLKALIKHFSHQSLSFVKGPATVVVGKKMRFTFLECGCDINSMLDASKIADVVLMLVNVRIGLEMYHFEFINMVQTHGMPRVIPVLNHLDTFKDTSSSRAARRKIKQRLWTDINSKIFLLSKFQAKKYSSNVSDTRNAGSIPGDYLLAEVRRLARLLMVKTPRPSDWRRSHPYLLIDRLEDVTDEKVLSLNPEADRCVTLYGWVRGAPLPPALTSAGIHIAGLGDFAISSSTSQPDPCPLPNHSDRLNSSENEKTTRSLSERDRKIYAPMSSLGGVLFDRDATYIDLGGSHYLSNSKKSGRQGNQLVPESAIDQMHHAFAGDYDLDEKLSKEHMVRIVGDAPFLSSGHVEEFKPDQKTLSNGDDDDDDDAEMNSKCESESSEDRCSDVKLFSDGHFAGFLVPAGTEGCEKSDLKKSQSLDHKSVHLQVKNILDNIDWRPTSDSQINWNRIVYGNDDTVINKYSLSTSGEIDSTLSSVCKSKNIIWEDPITRKRITDRFTTGSWDSNEDAETLLHVDAKRCKEIGVLENRKHVIASANCVTYNSNASTNDSVESSGEDDDITDDEDELSYRSDETEEEDQEDDDNDATASGNIANDESASKSVNAKDTTVDNSDIDKNLMRPTKRQKLLEKRKRHSELFNHLCEAAGGGHEATAFYDKLTAAREAQQSINREILRSLPEEVISNLEGFAPGVYVRVEIKDVPHQFVTHFDPCQPLVVGGLANAEESFGHILIRFRVHRWLKKTLRSNDPLTVSIGWRRYQTVCVFAKEEHNLRKTFLKYSLPHEHCLAAIYGPLVTCKTGVIAFVNSAWRPPQSGADDGSQPSFRVAGTGTVVDTDKSFQVMKKLKLIGEPYKIFSKTAFIRGMFNSELEVSKMIGVRIQTVSKIRGFVKAALTNPSTSKPGDFRGTFEARIQKADLIFLRTFVAVELPTYYNPVLNRLLPVSAEHNTSTGWRLLRTLTELRLQNHTKPVQKPDSRYTPISRPVYFPAPLRVPTKLVAALPFAHKPKQTMSRTDKDSFKLAQITALPPPVRAANETDKESRHDLLIRLRHLHFEFLRRQREKAVTRSVKHRKVVTKMQAIKSSHERKRRKDYFSHKGNKTHT